MLRFFIPGIVLISISSCIQPDQSFKEAAPVSRILFGSCARENKPQPILQHIIEKQPDLFIYLGDNIYGDTEDMQVMQEKYDLLGSKPEFQQVRAATTVLATWDDHDYGENDAGRHFRAKAASRELFLNFWEEPVNSERRKHEGIYHSMLLGPEDMTVQIILLDTRTFRDNLWKNDGSGPFKNDYMPNPIPDSTFLGDQQWMWLEQQLREPARIRIIASSNQFGHEYNGWESWTNVPHERQRMLDLISSTKANGVIFISGDVHWGELSKYEVKGYYPIYDLTSSGLTETWDSVEVNRNRVGDPVLETNYGMIEIDWDKPLPLISFRIYDGQDSLKLHHQISLEDINF